MKIMLVADPPDHTRLRRLANRAFTPRAVEALRPWIASLCQDLVGQARDADGAIDFMDLVAQPLPVLVICELLGVPSADRHQFHPWSSAIARMLDPVVDAAALEAAGPAFLGFVSYFSELIEERRRLPADDLLSSLIQAEADGDKLDQIELFGMLILLFVAGHETTTNLLGNGLLALLRQPEQMADGAKTQGWLPPRSRSCSALTRPSRQPSAPPPPTWKWLARRWPKVTGCSVSWRQPIATRPTSRTPKP